MKALFSFLVTITVLAAGAMYVQSFNAPCNTVLEYSVGSIDPRFGLTQSDFLADIQSMETVWEQPMGQELFKYNPEADFKINLVFDERQQKTLDERDARQEINLNEQSYAVLVSQYNSLKYQHEQAVKKYNSDQVSYETRLEAYNAEVNKFNKNGGATQDDYTRLSEEKKLLTQMVVQLERQRVAVNLEAKNLNDVVDRINEVASNLNLDVNDYNGKFGTSKQFDQGVYTGTAINIYQFNEETDLKLVVAHELGHALKLEHVEEPTGIMYYLMGQQDLSNIHLTAADLSELKTVCKVK